MRRHAPTPEQKAATAAKRAHVKELAERIKTMTPEELAALTAGTVPARIDGGFLSMRNTFLVILQNPNATVVGGFDQWRKTGRQVRKGEHGVSILVPRFDGDDSDEGTRELAGFLCGTVFDITQTDPISA